MPWFAKISSAFVLALTLIGCGRIAVFDDAALSNEAGIKYYPPKPYLLVSRTGAKEKPTEVNVIYLPDLSSPYYAKLKPGIGSSNLTMSFKDGMLISVGQNTDPQIDELITSIGSLATSARTAIAPVTPQATPLPELADQLDSISVELETAVSSAEGQEFLTVNQMQTASAIANQLGEAADTLRSPDGPELKDDVVTSLESVLRTWKSAIRDTSSGSEEQKDFRELLKDLRDDLERVIKELKGEAAPQAVLELYEIKIDKNGTTTLSRVSLE